MRECDITVTIYHLLLLTGAGVPLHPGQGPVDGGGELVPAHHGLAAAAGVPALVTLRQVEQHQAGGRGPRHHQQQQQHGQAELVMKSGARQTAGKVPQPNVDSVSTGQVWSMVTTVSPHHCHSHYSHTIVPR